MKLKRPTWGQAKKARQKRESIKGKRSRATRAKKLHTKKGRV